MRIKNMEQSIIIQYGLLSLVLLLTLVYFFLLYGKNRDRNLPPSPPSLPIVGHLHFLKQPLHHTLYDLSKKYGSIFLLRFGSRRVLIVSSFQLAQECFTKNDIALANRPKFLLGKELGYDHSTLLASPYGQHWRNLRRISANEILSPHRLGLLLDIRKDEIRRLMKRLSRSGGASRDFARVEMRDMLAELTFNIMMRMIAGKRYFGEDITDEEEASRVREVVKEVVKHGGASDPSDFLPILRWIDYGGYKKTVVGLAKACDRFLQALIEEHRVKKGSGEFKNTMIDHLLDLQKSQPEEYTDETIKGLVQILLLAGTDTSSLTLEWVLSNLLNNPEALEKVKAEIDAHIGQDRLIDEQDVSKLPYLQNIISETLRLNSVAPLLVPHESGDECTIGGYTIPRGTILLVNGWAIHKDPEMWKDPFEFKPERFEDGEKVHKLIMPFGIGRRACPGAPLAQRVVGLTLGSLIQCFEWKRVGEELVDMREGAGITMPKLVPLEAMCKSRPILEKVVFAA